jgi:hypothetical protein
MSLTKKIVIAIGVLLLVVVGYSSYVLLSTRSLSPKAVEKFEQGNFAIEIEYCRPFKKERLIFGTAEEGALLPYGQYWRLGANDATKLTLGSSIDFGGQPLKAGSYSLYAFPDADHWVIGINTEADRSGSAPPDFSKDVGRIKIPVSNTDESLEQFTISVKAAGEQAVVVMHWDQAKIEIPVKSTN